MTRLRLILAAAVLVVTTIAAQAFEQTQVGTGVPAAGAPAISSPAAGAKQPTGAGQFPGLDLTVPARVPSTEGTEIRLPMIGVIGRLPKLDFGLELLYGADKDKSSEEDPTLFDNDVTIRGSLKHRF